MIEERLEEEYKKGRIVGPEDLERAAIKIEQEVESGYLDVISNYSHKKILKTQKYKTFDEEGDRIRDVESKQKRVRKENNKGKRFWDSLKG